MKYERIMDIIDFANIPCTSGALEYLRKSDIGLNDLCTQAAFESIRSTGKERVLEALKDGAMKYRRSNKLAAEKELLAYPIARIIVSCINNNYLTKRYALAVARSSYEHIKDLKNAVLLKELTADLGLSIIFDDWMNVSMHFTDYIRFSHALHDPKWKMLNRTVKQGTLMISRDDLARLMEEAVRQKVESGLPHEVPNDIQVALESYIAEVTEIINTRASKQGFSKEGFSEVIPDCFPPCISAAKSDVQANMNLSHTMRFAMTSFLLNIGMTTEKVTEIFRTSPDFKEQATYYQTSHINGASGTTYTCPACATMATNGNCPGKILCKKIEHPLVYYRRKVWLENKKRVVQKQV
ncbi:MAG: DNA primase large subunit PriL [Candidatus Methanoperedens sp.]|nr:DNA primase large subunit PriL [Candidatus Methanoperedens sp.]MCE8429332.1 DNA primase large subunit PriL [Candidatus Methanoperedens sp.]